MTLPCIKTNGYFSKFLHWHCCKRSANFVCTRKLRRKKKPRTNAKFTSTVPCVSVPTVSQSSTFEFSLTGHTKASWWFICGGNSLDWLVVSLSITSEKQSKSTSITLSATFTNKIYDLVVGTVIRWLGEIVLRYRFSGQGAPTQKFLISQNWVQLALYPSSRNVCSQKRGPVTGKQLQVYTIPSIYICIMQPRKFFWNAAYWRNDSSILCEEFVEIVGT